MTKYIGDIHEYNENNILNIEYNETEIYNYKSSQLLSTLFFIIQKYKYIVYYIVISTIILIFYYFYIPFLYGKLIYYMDYYYYLFIVILISLIMGILWFVKGIEYDNFKSEKLTRLNIISTKIIKQFNDTEKYYTFEGMLMCKKRIDILECFSLNPKQFLTDYIELIKYYIIIQLNFLELKQKKEIVNIINPAIYKYLSTYFSSDSDNIEMNSSIIKLKEAYLNDIIYQYHLDDGLLIDYYYFLNLLKDINLNYKIIKKNNLISKGDMILRKFKGFNNLNLGDRTIYSDSRRPDSYFDKTLICYLVNKLKENNDYDANVDIVIRELYYEQFDTNIIDVKRIYGFIEDIEGVINVNNYDNNDRISYLTIYNQKIYMTVRYARDKYIENIGKKIQRKHNDLTAENIPWSIKLIKDWKRMSIIFKDEKEIILFIFNKKKLFGNDFNKELHLHKERITIRIYEIKNGFYDIKTDQESGNYRDVKIIYEVLVQDYDIAFFIECQLNLENLIIYKKVDHLIYDFERAKEEYEMVKSQQERYKWMKGNTRVFIQIMRVILIILAISSLGISLGIVLNDINIKLRTIWHANLKIKVNFIQGNYPNNICYSIDNDLTYCVGYTNISTIIQNTKIKGFNKLISNGVSLLGIDNDYKFINYNLSDYNTIQSDSPIFDIKQNNNLICYSNASSINCKHKIIHPSILSGKFKSYCVSANNNIECTGEVDRDQKDIPIEFSEGVYLLSVGAFVTCANRSNTFLCWGINTYGLLDIPVEFQQGVEYVTVGYYNICSGIDNLVKCWGLVYRDEKHFTDQYDSDLNLNEIPMEVQNGAELINLGTYNACAIRSSIIYCWGLNPTGINDIPSNYKDSVIFFTISQFQVCAYNGMFRCWGLDYYNIVILMPSFIQNMNLTLTDMADEYICVSSTIELYCWGDGWTWFIPDTLKTGVDQIAVGYVFYCGSRDQYIGCVYGDGGQYNFSDKDMKYHWNLPSIKDELTFVYHCDWTFCIFKGSLLCYSNTNGYIGQIPTPNDMSQISNVKLTRYGTICGIIFGKLTCWNLYLDGLPSSALEVPSEFHSSTVQFAIGHKHICAATPTILGCWGENRQGQLDFSEPNLKGVTHISANTHSTCATSDYRLMCWGSYFYNEAFSTAPRVPDHLRNGVETVEVGTHFYCALSKIDRYIYCWGYNDYGELDVPEEFWFVEIDLISVGDQFACAQRESVLKCWGFLGPGKNPNRFEQNGVDLLNSCGNTRCGEKDGEWICWGQYGILQRMSITENNVYENAVYFDITDDYDRCINYEGYIDCVSNKIDYERYSLDIKVEKSFLCMYVNYDKPYICYVDEIIKSKFACILPSDYDNNGFELIGDSNVTKVSCGTNHGCALFASGDVHCFGGSKEYDEAHLSVGMKRGAYDIRAGTNSTCILNASQIVCQGKDIDTQKEGYNLNTLQGLDEIIKFN